MQQNIPRGVLLHLLVVVWYGTNCAMHCISCRN